MSVSIDSNIAANIFPIADSYANSTGGQLFNVSDANRTADDQASAMYNNYQNDTAPSYKNVALEQQIHDAYTQGVDDKESHDAIVSDMAKVIQDAMDQGNYISDHLTGDAFDVSKVDAHGNPINLSKLQAAATAQGYTVLIEANHYHLQPK